MVFLATNKIYKASHKLAVENEKPFSGFYKTKFADGSYFKKYTNCEVDRWIPKTNKIKEIFQRYNITIPTQEDWIKLVDKIKKMELVMLI